MGTSQLRYTRLAARGDIAALSRVGESEYELRIIDAGTAPYNHLLPHMVSFIGHQGKRQGLIDNATFAQIIGQPVVRRGGTARPAAPPT